MGRRLKSNVHTCACPSFPDPGDIYICDCGQAWYAAQIVAGSNIGHYHQVSKERLHELMAPGEIVAADPNAGMYRRRTPRQWWRRLFQLDKYPTKVPR